MFRTQLGPEDGGVNVFDLLRLPVVIDSSIYKHRSLPKQCVSHSHTLSSVIPTMNLSTFRSEFSTSYAGSQVMALLQSYGKILYLLDYAKN